MTDFSMANKIAAMSPPEYVEFLKDLQKNFQQNDRPMRMSIMFPDREWEPIRTAPKDGTKILICEHFDYENTLYVASWCTSIGNGCWQIEAYRCPIIPRPTHWMLLPQQPKDAVKDYIGKCRFCPELAVYYHDKNKVHIACDEKCNGSIEYNAKEGA